jgi:pyruvate kinase
MKCRVESENTDMNNVKIVCTIGPSSSSPEMIEKLIDSGMNIARLNFSHGTHEEHLVVIEAIKRIREKKKVNVAILQDLCGPKIRTGLFPGGSIMLETGKKARLVIGDRYSDSGGIPEIPVSYEYLLSDIKEGGRILLDDGYIELRAEKREADGLLCEVVHGGELKDHKGVNFPGQVLSSKVPTDKDLEDLAFGVLNNVDFVALSFVQHAEEMELLRREIARLGGSASCVAKLERDTALENLDSIIEASDCVMVARGDLGIECEISMIPIYQKQIVRKCNRRAVPVIIATQMLESMIKNPIPTRAEVTDIANAIYDGGDAIMLSGETAVGAYPLETVRLMRKVADNVEANLWLDRGWADGQNGDCTKSPEYSIAKAACAAGEELNAKYIIANTLTGKTARFVSRFRPKTPILALTPEISTFYKLAIMWGVSAIYYPQLATDFQNMIAEDEVVLKKRGLAGTGDLIVVSAGVPQAIPGGTNLMKLHTIK